MTNLSHSQQPAFGQQLKQWRAERGVSQMQLALNSDTSSRHISFIETGRSRPSREMVMRLADALDLSLRDSNDLLLAAGFAPHYQESALTDDALDPARRALQFMLDKHEPYPSLVMNQRWEMVMANNAATILFSLAPPPPGNPPNLLRWMFEGEGLSEYIENWQEVAAEVLARARREALLPHADPAIQAVFDRLSGDSEIAAAWHQALAHHTPSPMLAMHLRMGDLSTRWITTIATFGTPRDVTLQELRIETFFPADEATEQIANQMLSVPARNQAAS